MYNTLCDVEGVRQKKRLRIHEVDNEEHTSRSDVGTCDLQTVSHVLNAD